MTVAARIDSRSRAIILQRLRNKPSRDSHGAVPATLSKSAGPLTSLVRQGALRDLPARSRRLLAGSDHVACLDAFFHIVAIDAQPEDLLRLGGGEHFVLDRFHARVALLETERKGHIARSTLSESDTGHLQNFFHFGQRVL